MRTLALGKLTFLRSREGEAVGAQSEEIVCGMDMWAKIRR
jgi:hypothetical protein